MELGSEASGWRVSITSKISAYVGDQLLVFGRVWNRAKGKRL